MSEPPDDKPRPSANEIRKQLERILASEEFVTRLKLAEVFIFLVKDHIDGKTPKEKDIRLKIFPDPPYHPEGTDVRTAIHAIRTLLNKFYESPGRYDPVVIALPKKFSRTESRSGKGKSYPVVCTYNRNRNDLTVYRLSQTFMKRGSPVAVRKALEGFEKVLRTNTEHRDAQIGRLECLCLTAFYLPHSRTKKEIIEDALASAMNLVQDDPGNWRAHMLFAVALICARSCIAALSEFAKAVALDPHHDMRKDLWFPTMYLLMGRLENARDIAYGIALDRVDDRNAWAAYGFSLYFNREFAEAESIFSMAVGLDTHPWLSHLGLAFVCLSTERPKEALASYLRCDQIIGEVDFIFPSVAMLAHSRSPGENVLPPHLLEQNQKLLQPPNPQKDWIQIALTIVDHERCVNSLVGAWEFFHPLMIVVPWWPVFDPQRGTPEFEQLMRDIDIIPKHSGDKTETP